MSLSLSQLSETRQSILLALKHNGPLTTAELVPVLVMTREAVRQHLMQLEGEGWIERRTRRDSNNGGGRPSMYYRITSDGERLFPKHYDFLTVEVLDTVAGQFGVNGFNQILATMADSRVREWEPRLRGLSLEKRVHALREIYMTEDIYMDVEQSDDRLCLVERNCPFFNVAKQRPALCSVTVSVLTRLLGYHVVREERFQNGDGRCIFRVLSDQPIDINSIPFTLEA